MSVDPKNDWTEESLNKTRTNEEQEAGYPPSLLGLQRSLMALRDAPEVRQPKVARLRFAIQSGRYAVDPGRIAIAMLRDWTGR